MLKLEQGKPQFHRLGHNTLKCLLEKYPKTDKVLILELLTDAYIALDKYEFDAGQCVLEAMEHIYLWDAKRTNSASVEAGFFYSIGKQMEHFTKCASLKYKDTEDGKPNWKVSCPKNPYELLNSAIRHFLAAAIDENSIDEETNTHHIYALLNNLTMFIEKAVA